LTSFVLSNISSLECYMEAVLFPSGKDSEWATSQLCASRTPAIKFGILTHLDIDILDEDSSVADCILLHGMNSLRSILHGVLLDPSLEPETSCML